MTHFWSILIMYSIFCFLTSDSLSLFHRYRSVSLVGNSTKQCLGKLAIDGNDSCGDDDCNNDDHAVTDIALQEWRVNTRRCVFMSLLDNIISRGCADIWFIIWLRLISHDNCCQSPSLPLHPPITGGSRATLSMTVVSVLSKHTNILSLPSDKWLYWKFPYPLMPFFKKWK